MDKNLEDSCLSLDLNSAPIRNSDDHYRNIEFDEDLDDGSKPSAKKDQSGLLTDQLNQMKLENKKLTDMLVIVRTNYNALHNHMMDLVQNRCGPEEINSILRKRKFEVDDSVITPGNDASNESIFGDGSPKRPKEIRTNISRVFVRTEPADSSLIVKDGYHWRKYGQKVTKDNPSPRAYYKCSFAPTCLVKKKVQRSIGDPSILVATYEGEHNHPHPLQAEMLAASTQGVATALSPGASCFDFPGSGRANIDSSYPGPKLCNRNVQEHFPAIETNAVQKLMVEQMASSLTSNPSFTAALVAAISGRILSHDPTEK